ncbi:MAG: 2-succinyl-6-hydroxy-2,4-cyclohexadiene-1-carboxylate synthase [Chlorobiaceae bacterium]|nr:2-succinyl-6-hydroxy-2,4-cyclohexadiene-1-carboxylate synthase [Chlorobiaceae bacterium]
MTRQSQDSIPHLTTVGDPSLPGILFLHGFLGSGRDWLPIAEALSDRYHCLMPDLPGHGATRSRDQTGPMAFHNAALDLLESVASVRTGPVNLVGYSMGGRMALYLVLNFPRRFTSAAIISASPGLRTEEERRERRVHDELLAAELEQDPIGFFDRWYRLPLFATLKAHPSFPEIFEARRAGNPKTLASTLRALGTGNQPSLWEKLPDNRLPIMFCSGEKDSKFVEIDRQMVNLCPCSVLEIFEECGHTLHLENHTLFLDRLTRFINKPSSLPI